MNSRKLIIRITHRKILRAIYIGIVLASFSFDYTFGQTKLNEVNFELIPYPTVRKYIQEQTDRNISCFSDLKPSWNKIRSTDEYNVQKKTYRVKEDLSKVWSKYETTSPTEAWNGKKVMFGFMFSKKENSPFYCGDNIQKIDSGQVIFLNLRLLKIYNLAMAFEVIAVDQAKKIIEFSYIEGNVSQGKQCLQFVTTPEGHTEIIHSSFFKSGSKMRDKFLYPFFHARTTNEFHRIMRKIIKKT